jgi:hypothetical protein
MVFGLVIVVVVVVVAMMVIVKSSLVNWTSYYLSWDTSLLAKELYLWNNIFH